MKKKTRIRVLYTGYPHIRESVTPESQNGETGSPKLTPRPDRRLA